MEPTKQIMRRAAVVGSPVSHSLSPVLHTAGYRALGLADWEFTRIDCDSAGLADLVTNLDSSWAGLAVTMPNKHAALNLATEQTPRAKAVGAANTLVPQHRRVVPSDRVSRRSARASRPSQQGVSSLPEDESTFSCDGQRWLADCTDVAGVIGALIAAGGYEPKENARALLLGAGGTAAAAIVGLAELGVHEVTLVAREPARATKVIATASRVGIAVNVLRWSNVDFRLIVKDVAVLINTVPTTAIAPHAYDLSAVPCALDVIYHPWPTPLAIAMQQRGKQIATGLDMLLHQSFDQFTRFTGFPAPQEAMRDALRDTVHTASGDCPPLPL